MGHRFLLLTAVLAVSMEAAFGTFTRGIGLNGQYYTGAGVGPLGLFRSTAENAAIVKEGFTGHPLGRFLALAYGDEFPNLRDDVIRRLKQQAERNSISTGSGSSGSGSGGAARAGGLFGLLDGPYGALISPQNWMFDRENNKKELNDPYRRPGLLSSITGGSSSGGSGGGLLSSVTGLLSSFRGSSGSGGGGGLSSLLGGLGGLGGSSSSSSSSSSGSSGFRITADTPTRAPSITSIVAELEKADDTAAENETNNPAAE